LGSSLLCFAVLLQELLHTCCIKKEVLLRKPFYNSRVCSKHFDEGFFTSAGRKFGAVDCYALHGLHRAFVFEYKKSIVALFGGSFRGEYFPAVSVQTGVQHPWSFLQYPHQKTHVPHLLKDQFATVFQLNVANAIGQLQPHHGAAFQHGCGIIG